MKSLVISTLIIGFFLGFTFCQYIDRRQLQAAEVQVEAAMDAVDHAHTEIDMLEGCHLRGTKPTIWALHEGEFQHD
jgi:hypothetical protein